MAIHCLLAVLPHQYAFLRTLCVAGIASAAMLLAASARAEPVAASAMPATRTTLELATAADLESAYLECDRMAMATLLDSGTAADCSIVYETFKARVFGGDFNRLLIWHEQMRKPAAAGPSPSRPAR